MTTSTTERDAREHLALPAALEHDLPWLVLATGLATAVYATYLVTHPYPAFGAGLFLRMAEAVAEAGYALPARVGGYTADGVPFAYPPLPFYALAVLLDAGVDPLALSRYLPGVFVVAALPPYFYAAKELLGSTAKAGLAASLLAVTPTALRWHLSAGGVVRALAFLFVAVGLYAGVRLFAEDDRQARSRRSRAGLRWLVIATVAFALTLLSHPIYAVFFGVSYVVLFWFRERTTRGLASGAVVAVGGLALAAPWLLQVIAEHGVGVFAGAAGTHGGLGGGIERFGGVFLAPLVPDAETPFYLAAYAGAAYLLYRREYLLPAWLFAAGYVVGKTRFLFVPGSMMTAILVAEWAVPRAVATGSEWFDAARAERLAGPLVVGAVVIVAASLGGLAAAGQLSIWHGDPSQPAAVDGHDQDAMAWVDDEVQPGATFVVLGDAAEWFPLLADRPILVGHWGTEWEGTRQYQKQLALYRAVSACGTAGCVTATLEAAGVRPDYVYVPKGHYTVQGEARRAPPTLARSLAESRRYEAVYENDGVAIFRVSPDRTPEATAG